MKNWIFLYDHLEYLRKDGAHVSQEYIDDCNNLHHPINDLLLDKYWDELQLLNQKVTKK